MYEQIREKIRNDVKKVGFSMMTVGGDMENSIPPFTYSIGNFETTGKPELIIFGLPPEVATMIISDYVEKCKKGETVVPEQEYMGYLRDAPAVFRVVRSWNMEEYLAFAKNYYKDKPFEALQLIWPSMEGDFPWDEGATKEYKNTVYFLGDK